MGRGEGWMRTAPREVGRWGVPSGLLRRCAPGRRPALRGMPALGAQTPAAAGSRGEGCASGHCRAGACHTSLLQVAHPWTGQGGRLSCGTHQHIHQARNGGQERGGQVCEHNVNLVRHLRRANMGGRGNAGPHSEGRGRAERAFGLVPVLHHSWPAYRRQCAPLQLASLPQAGARWVLAARQGRSELASGACTAVLCGLQEPSCPASRQPPWLQATLTGTQHGKHEMVSIATRLVRRQRLSRGRSRPRVDVGCQQLRRSSHLPQQEGQGADHIAAAAAHLQASGTAGWGAAAVSELPALRKAGQRRWAAPVMRPELRGPCEDRTGLGRSGQRILFSLSLEHRQQETSRQHPHMISKEGGWASRRPTPLGSSKEPGRHGCRTAGEELHGQPCRWNTHSRGGHCLQASTFAASASTKAKLSCGRIEEATAGAHTRVGRRMGMPSASNAMGVLGASSRNR